MTFYADLHLHSKYSRATSRDCDLEHIAFWARKKGVSVVATGDFTHPKWLEEIREKLVPAEPGLYRLRSDLEKEVDRWLDGVGAADPVRFVLEVEISTIYKKDDHTRKVHHVVYVPDLEKAKQVQQSLARIGNVASDGRPILGLDSRDLLEITLEAGEGCYLIPAHIWTPWFAVLGSKSGFDSVEHCYADLVSEIFALETGLSSDPSMNWRVSSLDRYALVSNSDAHSPPKIGREACVFHTEMDYFAMRRALQTGNGYGGTVEFFPEEGKYHFDGHRKCGTCLSPQQTSQCNGMCPVCGKPVTLGVMHRVHDLADRDASQDVRPPRAAEFRSLVPLMEVLGEILGVGPNTKTVQRKYEDLVSQVGPELYILEHAPLEDVKRAGSSLLAEGISRMRKGRVIRDAGFDGQYGTIRLFTKDELRRGSSVKALFDLAEEDNQPLLPESTSSPPTGTLPEAESSPARPATDQRPIRQVERATAPRACEEMGRAPGPCLEEAERNGLSRAPAPISIPISSQPPPPSDAILDQLDPEQRAAAEMIHGPLLIVAGPGTGKTRTLTHRLAHLVADHGIPPEQCLAITFTRRAAGEMTQRLTRLLPGMIQRLPVTTFHALGLSILQEHGSRLGLPQPLRVASRTECLRLLQDVLMVSQRKASQLLARIARRKCEGRTVEGGAHGSPATEDSEVAAALAEYQKRMLAERLVDFDDLLALPAELLQANPDLVDHYRSRYRWISVDEYQDINYLQYRLIRLLVPEDGNLCVIGDPDQAIYGFRGADVGYFQRFQEDFPSAKRVSLVRNYRSTGTIVDASLQLVAPTSLIADRTLRAQVEGLDRVEIHECATDRAEAEFVVHTVEQMIGGSTFFSMDSGRVQTHEREALSLADFAVLYRTDAQAELLVEAFARSGMPFQRRSHNSLAGQPGVQALIRAMHALPEDGSMVDRVDQGAAEVCADDPQLELSLPALRSLARRCGDSIEQFLSELALGIDVDLWDPRAERVAMLTLHAGKGLEFPVVFVVGCEDGLIPLHWGSLDESEMAEERRLLFVGMTRAQTRLFLTHARKRRWRGKVRPTEVSPFLRDIQQQLLDCHQHRCRKKPATQDKQQTLFQM